MMARRSVLGVLAAGTSFLLSSCGLFGGNTYRYKMTVEVATPQGLKTGYAVREVTYQKGSGFLFGEGKPQWYLTGEAVAVDLGGGKTLFALLTGADGVVDFSGRDISHIFRQVGANFIELWPNAPKTSSPRIRQPVPMLVTFANIGDPKSVMQVDAENLAARFGAGVRLKRIVVEVTDDAVTKGIEGRLPSYGPQTGFDQWFKTLNYGDPRAISKYDFKRGTNR